MLKLTQFLANTEGGGMSAFEGKAGIEAKDFLFPLVPKADM
jgi:hypothetical protein